MVKLKSLYEQPKALAKRVWQKDEHQTDNHGNKAYHWPRTTFHGQAEGWKEHQLS